MALLRIALRDFVIVRTLDLEFAPGFTVLTGETGAGKSILIDALQIVLGNRADTGVVREGSPRADITAEFDAPSQLSSWLDEGGFESAETLLLRRTVDAQGKSRAWINGGPATATQLRALGERLLDIHGQHAWQSLTRPDAVRALLDAYAQSQPRDTAACWQEWRHAIKQLEQARTAQNGLQHERERLQWQIGEVEKLSPGSDEWEDLNVRHTRLSNAQALLNAARSALEALEQEEMGAAPSLAKAQALLQELEHLEPGFKALADVLASCMVQAEDAAHTLHAYLRRTDEDPGDLAQLDERMALWMALARRFKREPVALHALWDGWKKELTQLDSAADLAGLEQAVQTAEQRYLSAARTLSLDRAKAAPRLSTAITQAMQGLGMQGGRFEVALQTLAEPTASGMEDVAFLVAGHPGTSPRPVGKVASGGELSRIALAIAVTTSELGTAQTLIFDEVDSGVGGAVAETVGRLMRQLGRDRQVLAVTHLPQVGACADHHLVVSKQHDAHGTSSTVTQVTGEQRVTEIARMLGGERLSGTTMAHAREMLSLDASGTEPPHGA